MDITTVMLMLAGAGAFALAYWYRQRAKKNTGSPGVHAAPEEDMVWAYRDMGGDSETPSSSPAREWMTSAARWLVTREKVQLAVFAAAFLAIAQFFTTAKGLSNFIPWLPVAILAAIGVQVILYLSAWLLAERSAHKAYLRRRERMSDGSDSEELRQARLAFGSAGRWAPVMFATGFFVSVFFSNDALFDFVYTKEQQDLTNIKVARSTVGAMFGTIEGKLREDRNAELKVLRDSKEWGAWQTGLATILSTAENSRDILQSSWNSQRVKLDGDVTALHRQEKDKADEVTRLKVRVETSGTASAPALQVAEGGDTAVTRTLKKREQELLEMIAQLEQQRGDLKVKLDVEGNVGGVANGTRRPKGEGPVYRELKRQLDELDNTLKTRRDELAGIKRNLGNAAREQDTQAKSAKEAIEQAKAGKELAIIAFNDATRQLNELRTAVKEAEGRRDIFMGQVGAASSTTAGAGDMVVNVRRALTTFVGSGSRESFKTLFDGCSALTEMLEREPQTKKLIGGASCDASAFASRIDRLASYDDATIKYRKECQVDEAFNALLHVKDMVDRARTCAGVSTLPFSRIKDERTDVDRLEQENSPTTSHFERTISTLRRGDVLAWLALGIAFSLDFLVLIAAMIGARAAISPLVRDGHVASQSDIDDLNISQNIDLKIYPNDPPAIRNQKILLSVIDDDALPSPDAKDVTGSVVHLQDVPPEHVAGISALLQTYTAKRLAMPDRRRPGVYRVGSSIVMQMTRDVGLYERDQQRRRTAAQWEQGYDVMRRNRWASSAAFDDFSDPYTPPYAPSGNGPQPAGPGGSRGADIGEPPPPAGSGNGATQADPNDGGGSGWSNLRRGDGTGDTKTFYN